MHRSTPSAPTAGPLRRGDEREDWLGGLRGWVQLCQRGHDPREAWQLLQRSQRTLS
ncbi:MAG: hypothetical protein ACKO0M_01050 [Cyanobium sp.]